MGAKTLSSGPLIQARPYKEFPALQRLSKNDQLCLCGSTGGAHQDHVLARQESVLDVCLRLEPECCQTCITLASLGLHCAPGSEHTQACSTWYVSVDIMVHSCATPQPRPLTGTDERTVRPQEQMLRALRDAILGNVDTNQGTSEHTLDVSTAPGPGLGGTALDLESAGIPGLGCANGSCELAPCTDAPPHKALATAAELVSTGEDQALPLGGSTASTGARKRPLSVATFWSMQSSIQKARAGMPGLLRWNNCKLVHITLNL